MQRTIRRTTAATAAGPGRPPVDIVTFERVDTPRHLEAVPAGPVDALADARERYRSVGLGGHLDTYLAAVAEALQVRGVMAGPPQRSDSASTLIGSIVIDCTAVRPATGAPGPLRPEARQPLGGASHHGHPTPVIVAWDEDHGWIVGLHHDSVNSSRRFLHGDLLPTPTEVAEFVVGLALGQPLGATDPVPATGSGPPTLRLLR